MPIGRKPRPKSSINDRQIYPPFPNMQGIDRRIAAPLGGRPEPPYLGPAHGSTPPLA